MRAHLFILLACFSCLAGARDRIEPVSAALAAQLRGKTVFVTRHDRPAFAASPPSTPEEVAVGGGRDGAGIVRANGLVDPADVLERELVPLVVKAYGLTLDTLPGGTPRLKPTDAWEIATSVTGVDYVLDIRSGGWNFSHYPRKRDRYWVGYSAQIQLIEVKTRKRVSNLACNANTFEHPRPPTRMALLENRAQLLKDVSTALAWLCVDLFSKEQFPLTANNAPPIPEAFVDPVSSYYERVSR